MGTYSILRRLLKFSSLPNFPLIERERHRVPEWTRIISSSLTLIVNIFIVGLGALFLIGIAEVLVSLRVSFLAQFTTAILSVSLPFCAGGFLISVMFILILWHIPIAIAGSTVIVHERTANTWQILLTTPIDRADILLSKLSAGLNRWSSFIALSALFQFIPFLLITTETINDISRITGSDNLPGFWLGLGLLIVMLALFAVERIQIFAAMTLAGLSASLVADSWATALVASIAFSLGFWVFRVLAIFAGLRLLTPVSPLDPMQILVVGAPTFFDVRPLPWFGIALMLCVIAVQEVMIRLWFRALLRRMMS